MEELINILTKYNLTIKEYRYRIKNDIPLEKVFTCKHCGKPIKYTVKHHYSKFCNKQCFNIYRKQHMNSIVSKMKQTCLEKYGVENYSQTKEYQEKFKKTCLSKYNVDNPAKIKFIQNKAKNTCLKKYGVEYYQQTKECQNKIKQTCLDKYGVDSYLKTEEKQIKTKQNNLKKYGVENTTQLQKVKDKMKQTNLRKYGAKTYAESQNFKQHQDEIQQKIYDTKKQNNTFHVSSEEEKVYRLLLTKFGKEDVERQYKSEVYPFACDFYIKSLDLYIEYNGYWTHGSEEFNKYNNKHLNILKEWKKKVNEVNFKGKKKKQFKSAIYTWTVLDPLKLKTAKDNKLNYKIFWTVKEVEDWLRGFNI